MQRGSETTFPYEALRRYGRAPVEDLLRPGAGAEPGSPPAPDPLAPRAHTGDLTIGTRNGPPGDLPGGPFRCAIPASPSYPR